MNTLDLRPLEVAHARAVNALMGNIPKLSNDEACEMIEALMAVVFETLKQYAQEEADAADYN